MPDSQFLAWHGFFQIDPKQDFVDVDLFLQKKEEGFEMNFINSCYI